MQMPGGHLLAAGLDGGNSIRFAFAKRQSIPVPSPIESCHPNGWLLSLSKKSGFTCHREPVLRLVWRSVLFVARRATRPGGPFVCQRHTQGFALQEMRIATPVCALARNDMVFQQSEQPPKRVAVIFGTAAPFHRSKPESGWESSDDKVLPEGKTA